MLHEMEIASSTNQWNGMKDLNTAQRTFHFRLVNYDNSSARFIPGIIDMGVIVLSHISRTCVYNVYTICIHKMYIQYVYTIYIYIYIHNMYVNMYMHIHRLHTIHIVRIHIHVYINMYIHVHVHIQI